MRERRRSSSPVRPSTLIGHDQLAVEDAIRVQIAQRDRDLGERFEKRSTVARDVRVTSWPRLWASARKPSCFSSNNQAGSSNGRRNRARVRQVLGGQYRELSAYARLVVWAEWPRGRLLLSRVLVRHKRGCRMFWVLLVSWRHADACTATGHILCADGWTGSSCTCAECGVGGGGGTPTLGTVTDPQWDLFWRRTDGTNAILMDRKTGSGHQDDAFRACRIFTKPS